MSTSKSNFIFYIAMVFFSLNLSVVFPPASLYAHGSQGHDENAFSNYDAVKKSLEVFDTLLMKKKLGQDWKIDFSDIVVLNSVENSRKQIMVRISRQKGNPESLYIFFDETGKYKGSNFKGK